MDIGAIIPIIELRHDVIGLRDFVQAAEELGYGHIRMLDHVLGADPKFHPEVSTFYYTHESYIHGTRSRGRKNVPVHGGLKQQ